MTQRASFHFPQIQIILSAEISDVLPAFSLLVKRSQWLLERTISVRRILDSNLDCICQRSANELWLGETLQLCLGSLHALNLGADGLSDLAGNPCVLQQMCFT